MTAFLSGEMKDTVEINPAGAYGESNGALNLFRLTAPRTSVLDRFFSKKDRAKLFRSWAGSASMWIKVRFCSYFIIHS